MTSVLFYDMCQSGTNDDVWHFISEKIDECSNWDLGLTGACKSGNTDVQQLMVDMGATGCGNCGKAAKEHVAK